MVAEPIRFHRVHGENIRISNDGKTVKRVESFNQALCFTNRPLQMNEKLKLRITCVTKSWSGTLRIGVTQNDPEIYDKKLPKYCCPDLNLLPGNWGKAVDEKCAVENKDLTIYYTSQGNVMLQVDMQPEEIFITGVRTSRPLFALFDVYGNTQGIEILGTSGGTFVGLLGAASRVPVISSTPPPASPSRSPASTPTSTSSTAGSSAGSHAVVKSEIFKNIVIKPAALLARSDAHTLVTKSEAKGIHKTENGMIITQTRIKGGQAIIVKLLEMHRVEPICLALSNATAENFEQCKSIDELCESTYTVSFKTGLPTIGEEIAILISESGAVYVSHSNAKWLQTVYVDTKVEFHVVLDSIHIKRLAMVGVTSQLQQPRSLSPDSAGSRSGEVSSPSISSSFDNNGNECVICLSSVRDILLEPCCHFVVCQKCSTNLTRDSNQCPICRQDIKATRKIFCS